MAKAKKLPSGSWSCLAYSHTETVNGKKKRIYERFTAPTKKEAEFLAAEFQINKSLSRNPQNITVRQAIYNYIESKSNIVSASTVRTYLSTAEQYFPVIGEMPLSKLTQEAIQKDMNTISAYLAPKTVKNIHGLLSAALAVYMPNFRLRTSLPKKEKIETYIPTENDIRLLLKMVEGKDFYIPLLLASSLGLRRGEICGLKWTDIDFKNATLTVRTSMVLTKDNTWYEKPPKSYAGYRVLDLPSFVLHHLEEERKRRPDSVHITEINPGSITKRFMVLQKNSGLPHFRFHDLRHYYASMMLANNIPDKYAMKRMGHATNSMLKMVYQHTTDQKDKEVTQIINQHLETGLYQ